MKRMGSAARDHLIRCASRMAWTMRGVRNVQLLVDGRPFVPLGHFRYIETPARDPAMEIALMKFRRGDA